MAGAAAFLVVDVAGAPCAVRREAVREILPLPRLWRPPGVPAVVAGFLDLGGQAVPVIDLARLFGLDPAGEGRPMLYRHLLLVGAEAPLALLVDRVADLVGVADEAVSPVAESAALNGCVAAEVRIGERLLHELAVPRILLAEERARLDAQTRLAQERLAEWAE